jgi:hypothetical protein
MKKGVLLLRIAASQNLALLPALFREGIRRVFSNEMYCGFCFDLTGKIKIPILKIPLRLMRLREHDLARLFLGDKGAYEGSEVKKRVERALFAHSGIGTCYVGVSENDLPCVACWLITASDNRKTQRFFRNGLPELRSDEVMLEQAYTHSAYRGNNLMAWITLNLFQEAARCGARRAIAFVHQENDVSLAASLRIGWKPYMIKDLSWRLMRRKVTFRPFVGTL